MPPIAGKSADQRPSDDAQGGLGRLGCANQERDRYFVNRVA